MVETLTGQRAKCSRGEQLTAGRGCGAWRHWYFGGWWLCSVKLSRYVAVHPESR